MAGFIRYWYFRRAVSCEYDSLFKNNPVMTVVVFQPVEFII
jgi:hypothetical protein